MRTIILHYHLFKNAGTSLDQILKGHFGTAWVTREFSGPNLRKPDMIKDWIVENPDASVFSSHTMSGPLPHIDGVRILPVMILRDPIARIKSAYKFERQQVSDSLGARLAKKHDLENYVLARLKIENDRQCRNFHMSVLASFTTGSSSELDRAKKSVTMLKSLGVIGFVENFEEFVENLASQILPIWPDFTWKNTRSNTSDKSPRLNEDPDLISLLEKVNADDIELVNWARARL